MSTTPSKADIHITADQSYQLHVNGRYVCRGPARGFQQNWPIDAVNIAQYLKTGENLIAIRAYNPGYSNFQYVCHGYAGLLFFGKIGNETIISDETWKCRRQSGIQRSSAPVSMQLFSQEIIDLNEEDPNWMQLGYDDSFWSNGLQSCEWNAMPWHSLSSRDIPLLHENEISPFKQIGEQSGISHKSYTRAYNLSTLRHDEGLQHTKSVYAHGNTEVAATKKGHWRSILFDLEKVHVGSLMLQVDNAIGGEIIDAHFFETIDEESLTPDYAPDAHCRMAFANRLTARPGSFKYSFYHAYGFRYLILTIRDNLEQLIIKPTLRTAVYPHKLTGKFHSSETELNRIWETCAWTQEVCCLDAYVDTPWREQAQWWGDARVQAWNTFHMSGDARLFNRGIRQIAAQTTPDGLTYGHAPTIAHNCILPDFTLIWIITLWDYYWQTGSLAPFMEHIPQILNALDYFEKWTDPDLGLLKHDNRFWLFLDWTELRKDGYSSVYNLWYLYALNKLVKLSNLAGLTDMANTCTLRADRLRIHLNKLITDSGLLRDGYTENGCIDNETSIHAQTLSIMTQLSPANNDAMINKRLLAYLNGTHQTSIHPSAYWITYVYTVLNDSGHAYDVLRDILKRWGPMVAHGTTWENFEPKKGHESHSHAWSAHPIFHLMQIIGGIRQTAPKWESIRYTPLFYGDSANIVIPTPLGNISSKWQRQKSVIKGNLHLPDTMSASVHLMNHKSKAITGSYEYEVEL
ncbi:alpha-L-rhamnosidase N-terminal domain-containing protein [Cerasicoccus frondis]|uniref:alpha-L-rhamnosidase-related protein n=1 Tax=Cerasicoccus frondis TaxID=490090 RepID=UPI002852D27C|nr:alpha-L-rhamnosidase N-terminal domain-containing protein [Cerasicoccus frondis]